MTNSSFIKFEIAILAICFFSILSCTNKKNKESTDPANVVVPSNSDATNPSLADTAYGKSDSAKKDTARQKH